MTMDPASLLGLIGSGLSLVDQFYDLTKKLRGEEPGEHRVNVKTEEAKIVVSENGYEQEIEAHRLNLAAFDRVRHDALRKRINTLWKRYNGIDVKRASASADEEIRLTIQMDELREQLCPAFRELVGMYENVLGVGLPDHYTLYDVCAD